MYIVDVFIGRWVACFEGEAIPINGQQRVAHFTGFSDGSYPPETGQGEQAICRISNLMKCHFKCELLDLGNSFS